MIEFLFDDYCQINLLDDDCQTNLFDDVSDELVEVAVDAELDVVHEATSQLWISFGIKEKKEISKVDVLKDCIGQIGRAIEDLSNQEDCILLGQIRRPTFLQKC